MNIIGVGDLLIPKDFIDEGFDVFRQAGCSLKTVDWVQEEYDELQHINLLVETEGAEAYQADDAFLDQIKDAEVLITQFFPVNRKVIDACPNLKAVGVLRGGYENISLDYANEKGIAVYHTPGRNATAVADFAVGMLLCECRNIAKSHLNLKKGEWVRDYDNQGQVPDLAGNTVGIIGFGAIGRKVAKRLNAFDMTILAYDPYATDFPDYVKNVSLEELLKNSRFVTLHSRLSDDTYHLLNQGNLSLMREDAYLINTARSGLIDEAALYDMLKNKKIKGAALDVFDEEPPGADYPLVTLENVTITPHLAGGTTDAFTQSPKLLAAEMIQDYKDPSRRSSYLINPESSDGSWA